VALSFGPGVRWPPVKSALTPPEPRPSDLRDVLSRITDVIAAHGDNTGVKHVILSTCKQPHPSKKSRSSSSDVNRLNWNNFGGFLSRSFLSSAAMTSPVQTSGAGAGSAPGPSSHNRQDTPVTTEETPLLAGSSSSSSSSVRPVSQKDSNSRHVESTQSKVHIPLARGIAIGLSLWLLIFLTGMRFHIKHVPWWTNASILTCSQHVICLA
jgi:hypothetical protein